MRLKNIEGYENYMVSDTGMILNTKRNVYLKPVLNERYMIVLLYKNNKRKKFYVHRLVAEAFCEKNEGKKMVNHKDLDKTNNHYSNLEWVSARENVMHFLLSEYYTPRKMSVYHRRKISEGRQKKVKCLLNNLVFESVGNFACYKQISLSQASQKLNGVLKNNLDAVLYLDK